jgi:hypothetical protein
VHSHTDALRLAEIEATQAKLRRNIEQSKLLIDSARRCLEQSRRVREPEHA